MNDNAVIVGLFFGSVLADLFYLTILRLLIGWAVRRFAKASPQSIGRLLIINASSFALIATPALIIAPGALRYLGPLFVAQSIIFCVDVFRHIRAEPPTSLTGQR